MKILLLAAALFALPATAQTVYSIMETQAFMDLSIIKLLNHWLN
jgi:hypothetical protein